MRTPAAKYVSGSTSVSQTQGIPFITVSPSATYDGSNFGAFTTGTHTSGIQEALNALVGSGGTLYFKPGKFLVNTPIVIPSSNGLYLVGGGSPLGGATQGAAIPSTGTVIEFTSSCVGTDGFGFGNPTSGNVVTGFSISQIGFWGAQACPLTNSLVNFSQAVSQTSQVSCYNITVCAVPMLYNMTPPKFALVMDNNSDSVLFHCVTVGAALSWSAGGGSAKLVGGKYYCGLVLGGQTFIALGTTFGPGIVAGSYASPTFASLYFNNTLAASTITLIGCYGDAAYSNYFSAVGTNDAQAGATFYNASGHNLNIAVIGGRLYGSIGNGPLSTATLWSSVTAYVAGNYVIEAGEVYECILANTNEIPPNATYWTAVGLPASPAFFYSGGIAADAFTLSARATTFLSDGTNNVPMLDPGVTTHTITALEDVQFTNNALFPNTSDTLSGLGQGNVVAMTLRKAETAAADASVLLMTAPGIAGLYRITISCETAAATSAGVIGFTLKYPDANGNNLTANNAIALFQMNAAAPALTFTATGVTRYYGSWLMDVGTQTGVNIVIGWVGGGTTTVGIVSVIIEQLA
jgi:hypothetical protein